jgi:hypothetical protein
MGLALKKRRKGQGCQVEEPLGREGAERRSALGARRGWGRAARGESRRGQPRAHLLRRRGRARAGRARALRARARQAGMGAARGIPGPENGASWTPGGRAWLGPAAS